MQKTRKVLSVFLASPSDVGDERAAAERIVASVNTTLGRALGWQIDLHRWEDVPPGFGRPQDLINPMIDDCDLFIGLVWERWGTPSGGYSSGFQEEYEIARYMRRTTKKPEIWIVFKKITQKRLESPDEQLTKVLQFRELQMGLNEAIFKEVNDTSDWSLKLSLWLSEHLVKLSDSTTDHRLNLEAPIKQAADANQVEMAPLTRDLRKALMELYSRNQTLILKTTNVEALTILNECQVALATVLSADDVHHISSSSSTHRSLQLSIGSATSVLMKERDTLPRVFNPGSILVSPVIVDIGKLLEILPKIP